MQRLPSYFALRTLEAAARHGSYSAAARELGLTQGAVSQQIRGLEAEFGARLFQRRSNQMIPSPAAAKLAAEVRAAIDRLQAAVAEVATAAAQDPLVLSMENRFATRWLGPKLARLLGDPAGANLSLRVEERVADFTSDEVDAAIRLGRGDWTGLQAERLTTERFWVVCSPDFAARHPIAAPADLLGVPLIHNPERLWPLLFDPLALPSPPTAGLVLDDSLLVLDAVARGLGAALVRSTLVEEDVRAGRLVRPLPASIPLPTNFIRPGKLVRFVREGDPPPPEYGYFLVWRPDSRKQRRIQALRDWLMAETRSTHDEPR
jgi:LysR family glycine cleavage system transcriptional activator